MSEALSIVVKPTPGITPEQASDIRARAWAYIFGCYAKKKGGVSGTADDGKETRNAPASTILPQQ